MQGLNIEGKQLTHVIHVDDCIVLGEDKMKLEQKIQQILQESHAIALAVKILEQETQGKQCLVGSDYPYGEKLREVNI
ncbi:unnamed protein product [Soboliphyme baturini]|uniref:Reverse transcriptase domain-containing protein n=1 Tax=Soboliphyme baturini TaxID=241478 RepID=A0A183J8G9_9BILA|nr:unnamed protein product [Soboliphyme baturini]